MYPEGEHELVLRAARIVADDHIAEPVLMAGRVIRQRAEALGIDMEGLRSWTSNMRRTATSTPERCITCASAKG